MANNRETSLESISETARVAANIEEAFNRELGYEQSASGKTIGGKMKTSDGNEYLILDEYIFPNEQGDYQKAVVLKKGNEVYFHFNGTGDGNWKYNAAAYGLEPQPSDMQKGCAEWFDQAYKELYDKGIITDSTKINVTGHSQGGNNAMYVTMRSEYASKIDVCVPLDGPGFSDKFVNDTKKILGSDYNNQADKIWAFNGEHDYVSTLGQNSIVPEGHTKYIRYSQENADFEKFHASEGLLKDGKFVEILDDDGLFRKRLQSAISKVKDLSQEDQAKAAEVMMALCENFIGDPTKEPRRADLTPEDFERLKHYLIPVLTEFLAYNPKEISQMLQDVFGIEPDTAQIIENVIINFNALPENAREEMLESVLDIIVIKDGKIDIDLTNAYELYIAFSQIVNEELVNNPEDLMKVFEKLGIKNKPLQAAVAFAYVVVWKFLDGKIKKLGKIFDVFITVLRYFGIDDEVVEFIVGMFNAVISIASGIKQWWREKTNKGVKYARDNPYFRADTDRLYYYAARVKIVRKRLDTLHENLNLLFSQTGYLDVQDIYRSRKWNDLYNYTTKILNYLTDTSDRLSMADFNAKSKIGG